MLALGLLLSACAAISGGTDPIDDGPINALEALADQLSASFTTLPVQAATPTAVPTVAATPDETGALPIAIPAPEGTVAVIGNTGGTGVSIRETCVQSDRTGGTLPEGAEVAVLNFGAEECEGWSQVASGEIVSWIDNQYLTGLPGLGGPDAPAQDAEVRAWLDGIVDGAGRIASVSRGPGISMSLPLSATYLDHVREDAEALRIQIDATPQAIPACEQARAPLTAAAATIASLAGQLAAVFRGWPDTDVTPEIESLVEQYIDQQTTAARQVEQCATAQPVPEEPPAEDAG